MILLYIVKCMHGEKTNYTYSANLQYSVLGFSKMLQTKLHCMCLCVLTEVKYRPATEGVHCGGEGS